MHRLGKGVFVRAAVGDTINNFSKTREMCIGEIVAPSGKNSYRVNFYGIGLVTNLSSRSLHIITQEEMDEFAQVQDTHLPTDDDNADNGGKYGVSNTDANNDNGGDLPELSSTVVSPASSSSSSSSRSNSRSTASNAPSSGSTTRSANTCTAARSTRTTARSTHTTDRSAARSSTTNTPRNTANIAVGGVATIVGNEEVQGEGGGDTATITPQEANVHTANLSLARQDLQRLVGTQVLVPLRRDGPVVKWTVVEEHSSPPFKKRAMKYIGFNWDAVEYSREDPFVFAKMFLSLMFDDWQFSLVKMNSTISEEACSSTAKTFLTEEFLKGLAVMIGASCFNQKGYHLFLAVSDTVSVCGQEVPTVEQAPNFRRWMYLYRWKHFVKYLPTVWHNHDRKTIDPWWKIRSLFEEVNSVRTQYIMPSNTLVFDESMIGYRPQISETGNIPHIANHPDKPCDLGPEVKELSCGVLGVKVRLELQEGKMAMPFKKFNKEFGNTTGLVIRVHEDW